MTEGEVTETALRDAMDPAPIVRRVLGGGE